MLIIPAIDIRGGKCVRLAQGAYDRETVYDENPVEVAKRWEAEGATYLHVVDLDGAREGAPVNADIIHQIATSVNMFVQVGGGIRSEDTARMYLEGGVGRVIIGTVAAMDQGLTRVLFEALGQLVVVSIDARDGVVSIAGWRQDTSFLATDLAHRLVAAGCRRFVFTDISRDGMLTGPNLKSLSAFARAAGVPVIASGGISSLRDIESLKHLTSVGVEAAIIGKALYDGRIRLKEALAVAEQGD